jgi:GNAT superfamily N-acetyltransferase
VIVRRVRRGEWQQVRELRLAALLDPDAGMAFLDSHAHAAAQPAAFWIARTDDAADSDRIAQFIAEQDGEWVGSASVILRRAGGADHQGREVTVPRADVVGVFVRPDHRGDGTIDLLLAATAEWAYSAGATILTLDVHADNLRAQGAYRRAGFAPTGETFTGTIGPELVMARALPA